MTILCRYKLKLIKHSFNKAYHKHQFKLIVEFIFQSKRAMSEGIASSTLLCKTKTTIDSFF